MNLPPLPQLPSKLDTQIPPPLSGLCSGSYKNEGGMSPTSAERRKDHRR